MGIINISSQSINQNFRLTLPMLVPGDIDTGWRSYAGITWTNIWAQEESYLMDYEKANFNAGIAYGFNERWGFCLSFDKLNYFGGALDSLIQSTHDFLGVSQNHRDEVPKNRAIIERFDKETGDLIEEISATKLNSSGVSLLVNWNVFNGTEKLPSVNIYGKARYILERPDVIPQEKRYETGLGLGVAKRWTDLFYTYGVLGYSFYNNIDIDSETTSDSDPLALKNRQVNAMAAVGFRVTQDLTLLVQYLFSTSVVKDIKGLEEDSHEIFFGGKYNLSENKTVDFALIENIITMDNSPDFGLQVAISQRF